MAIPKKIKPARLNDYLEIMSKAVFQAGLSWASIDQRWIAFGQAFAEFDPEKVAEFSHEKIQQLLEDPSLLLNEKKVEATIHNAKILLMLEKEYKSFGNYLHAFENYESLSRDLKKQFKYLGDLNVYYFLFRVGEKVPPFEDWSKTIKGDHPRMKEMVEAAQVRK